MTTERPPFDPASLPPGTRIGGKYELGAMIGFGEHSVVFKATHRLLQRTAAVKVLATTDPQSERRFAREARLAGSLSHPNIVEVYEVGRLEDGRAFLAMEFLDGENLEERLSRIGPFSIASAMSVGRQLLFGLSVAHENNIVHRDVRPPNIFMAHIRGEEVVKILDFGISRRFGSDAESTLTTPGSLIGHMAYLAPEQLYEDGEIDHRTDLYACGILLYRLLTGEMPFKGRAPNMLLEIVNDVPPPPSSLRKELTKDVDKVIMTALAKEQGRRFKDAEAMAEALRLTGLFASYVD